MKLVKCPVCKSAIQARNHSCPACETEFSRFTYFRMNWLNKVIALIILAVMIYNCVIIIAANREIRSYLTRDEAVSEETITMLEEKYNNLNFIQRYFVHKSEIEALRKSIKIGVDIGICEEEEKTVYFEDGSRTGIYTGQVEDGVPHGAGKFDYADKNGNNFTYEGEFKEGKFSGYGILYFSTGHKHCGFFENGRLNGYATMYNPNGHITSQGQFVNGKLSGLGAIYDGFGNLLYKGRFVDGIPQRDQYTKNCSEIPFNVISDYTDSYINKNVKVTGTLYEIHKTQDGYKYILTDGERYIIVDHEGAVVVYQWGTTVSVYGYCTGTSEFMDSKENILTGATITSYHIIK